MTERQALDGGLRGQMRRRIGISPIGSRPGPPQPALVGVGCLGMLVGALVWWLFWFGDAVPPTGLRKWGSALFAALFFLGGLFFALLELRNLRWWAERRMRGGTEPWGEGYRWSRAMPPLPRPGVGWLAGCVGVAALTTFGAAINLMWLDTGGIRGSRPLAYALTSLFTLVVLAMLLGAALTGLRSLRRGRARLHLRDYPASPGGRLSTELELPKRYARGGPCKATLACVEEARRASDPLTGPAHLVVEVVAARETRIDLGATAAEGRRPIFEFELPADALPTALDSADGRRRYWVLEIGLHDGVGWAFLVPVYTRSE